jgi:dTDP-4-amino-4,6-dideoxy-D-glucose acyltransferase
MAKNSSMTHGDAYYSEQELQALGFRSLGSDVLFSRRATVYGAPGIALGNHVRVDDFVVLTCGDCVEVTIGDHVHISAHAALFGGGGLVLENYVTVSGRTSIYSATDDYGGDHMVNPTIPPEFTGVVRSPVVLRRHVVVGASSVILPGVTIGEGCAIGAMTLVNRDLEPWAIYAGIPARLLRPRSRGLLEMETKFQVLQGVREPAPDGIAGPPQADHE